MGIQEEKEERREREAGKSCVGKRRGIRCPLLPSSGVTGGLFLYITETASHRLHLCIQS